jgi:hypothetical protein
MKPLDLLSFFINYLPCHKKTYVTTHLMKMKVTLGVAFVIHRYAHAVLDIFYGSVLVHFLLEGPVVPFQSPTTPNNNTSL